MTSKQIREAMNNTGYENMDDGVIHQYQQFMARRIGPFNFEIDEAIDAEILNDEQVRQDLDEVDGILDKGIDANATTSTRILGKNKRKKKYKKMF